MECWHMSGAGNDFMVLDARDRHLDFPALAAALCARTGADGFMALDRSETADFKLHFYNSDGSRGEMCGNGCRCICRFAYDHGLAGAEMTVETDAGPVPGWRLAEDRYRIRLNDPTVLDLTRRPDAAYVELGRPGSPHGIVELPGLTWEMAEALRDRAAALRRDPAFPKGANITFFTWIGENTVRALTYERGVEDYTLACGTGSGSLACVLFAQGRLPGGCLTVRNRGGALELRVAHTGSHIDGLYLEGPAAVVSRLEIDPEKLDPFRL